jgi:hypothetical protein
MGGSELTRTPEGQRSRYITHEVIREQFRDCTVEWTANFISFRGAAVDYQTAETQAAQLQTQANQTGQQLKQLAEKLQAKVTDPNLSRELLLDLREAALAVQQQNQSALALLERMAQYIHVLESHLNTLPQSSFQTRGWAAQPYYGSAGGFMGNVVSGLGLGAGFGLASDLVSGIFNAL